MVSCRYFDESFDTENCHNYILSIQCSLNGFYFIVYDTLSMKYLAYFEESVNCATSFQLKYEIESLLEKEKALQKQYLKVNIEFKDTTESLYPNSIVDLPDLSDVYELMTEKKSGYIVLRNEIIKGEVSLAFSIPEIIHDFFKIVFPDCNYYSGGSYFLDFVFKEADNNKVMALARSKNSLKASVTDGNKILFFNNFYVKNDSDCLYYTLYIARQLELEKNTEILLMGDMDAHGDFVSSLKNYFGKAHFARINKRYSLSSSFMQKPDHYYLPLTQMSLCE
ncbi:MAG: DUF3822 family protein [Candidatus Cloacimonetes bacterium]|nr:DUF3822 family protein [Candidatus Cloacimonadota bacterium]